VKRRRVVEEVKEEMEEEGRRQGKDSTKRKRERVVGVVGRVTRLWKAIEGNRSAFPVVNNAQIARW
jgi:hypothetical protein